MKIKIGKVENLEIEFSEAEVKAVNGISDKTEFNFSLESKRNIEVLKKLNGEKYQYFETPSDFNGESIVILGKYKFAEQDRAQRPGTDYHKYDILLEGKFCYVKAMLSDNEVRIEIPAQKGWSTPVKSLIVHSHWLEKVE